VLTPRIALAGGFEIPDNGTEALGRGGAFVAKASDPTAIYHNPAGLGRQRGTRLLANANVSFQAFEFQRSGTYPGNPSDPATPWAGTPFPVSRETAGAFVSPFFALATDFGYFDRLTFAVGIYGPPVISDRTFELGIDGKPSASRYDYVQSRNRVRIPTASLGLHVTEWLDVGVSGHLYLSDIDQTSVSYSDLGREACPSPEYYRCDSRSTLDANGTSVAATFGTVVRPAPFLAIGAMFRTPVNVRANGTVTPESPLALQGATLQPGAAELAFQLPWTARLGARYIDLAGSFERFDLELDLVYEAWGVAQSRGPILDVPDLGAFKNIRTLVVHRYDDTIGVRGGGAYNIDTGHGVLALRGGAYYDASATSDATTRLDFDTLAKIAGTLGAGFKLGAFGIDVAYAGVTSLSRTVAPGTGDVRPVNGTKNGRPIGADDQPLAAVNEGSYSGFTHILSLGLTIAFDELFGSPRTAQ
jgi:long-subunit fatty acid transport protein